MPAEPLSATQALAGWPADAFPGLRIAARVHGLPPTDWRDALARRLGARPRRLGLWAELALWGARCCLDAAGLPGLPPGARLQVCSLSGPVQPLHVGIEALAQGESPLPYTFLQSQPAVMLAALGAYLQWQGDAVLLNHRDPQALLRVAARHARGGVLLGWVDERPGLQSDWLWLQAEGVPPTP
jgi:hypothetical protein